VMVSYPDKTQILEILNRNTFEEAKPIKPVIDCEELSAMNAVIKQIYMDEKLKEYIVNLVLATHEAEKFGMKIADYIQYGASPRAAIFLAKAARVSAFLSGRAYVTPQDIKQIGPDVLRHRIILSFEAEAEEISCENILETLFESVEVP
jgi:MoxR-like ATPase